MDRYEQVQFTQISIDGNDNADVDDFDDDKIIIQFRTLYHNFYILFIIGGVMKPCN